MRSEPARSHERGAILIVAIFVTALLFAITGSLISVSRVSARRVDEAVDLRTALYLAEGGLEASKRELAVQTDLGTDGVGNATATTSLGTYSVKAIDQGNDFYRLTSMGTSSGQRTVTVSALVEVIPTTKFPNGALSVVGSASDLEFKLEHTPNLILDGADAPALVLEDPAMVTSVGNSLASAVRAGTIPAGNITGTGTNDFGGTELSIVQGIPDSLTITDLTTMYGELVDGVQRLLPTATVQPPLVGAGTDAYTFGSPAGPEVVHFPGRLELTGSSTLTGYGTLIISERLNLRDLSSLNWHGDVIILGATALGLPVGESKVEIYSNLNVTGNIVMLGMGAEETEFEVEHGGTATVQGSFFMGSHNATDGGFESELAVDTGSSLRVDGLLSMIGSEVELEVETGGDLYVDGMMQVGIAGHNDLEFELELAGNVEVHKNNAAVQAGARELDRLGVHLDVPEMRAVLDYSVVTRTWAEVHP